MVWLSPSPKGPFLESGPPSTSSWLHVCKKKKTQLQKSADFLHQSPVFLQLSDGVIKLLMTFSLHTTQNKVKQLPKYNT